MKNLVLGAVSVVVMFVAIAGFAGAVVSRTITLNWSERREYSSPHMRFHVAWVRIAGDRWTVRASFTNQGEKTLKAAPEQWASGSFSPNYGFSIVRVGDQYHSVNASVSNPRIPVSIGPHATWSGTFGGAGANRLPRGVRLYISFGYFVDPSGNGFSWLTGHSLRL